MKRFLSTERRDVTSQLNRPSPEKIAALILSTIVAITMTLNCWSRKTDHQIKNGINHRPHPSERI